MHDPLSQQKARSAQTYQRFDDENGIVLDAYRGVINDRALLGSHASGMRKMTRISRLRTGKRQAKGHDEDECVRQHLLLN